jgi:hypothetical protein
MVATIAYVAKVTPIGDYWRGGSCCRTYERADGYAEEHIDGLGPGDEDQCSRGTLRLAPEDGDSRLAKSGSLPEPGRKRISAFGYNRSARCMTWL